MIPCMPLEIKNRQNAERTENEEGEMGRRFLPETIRESEFKSRKPGYRKEIIP